MGYSYVYPPLKKGHGDLQSPAFNGQGQAGSPLNQGFDGGFGGGPGAGGGGDFSVSKSEAVLI